ncbi:hypothetical protein CDEST_01301 [Colletotrichum destructivum]|uniref:F-box domain-containing protein n=1 Tax=Colletotrichum destructivum TaxID=34406 RepID=A0AAX4HYP2_9PEZI|nr:hypothetical protein CDEST_01301 [Colletotrichum destructivum]
MALLNERRRGEKRRPSRVCEDLLPYRYATHREVDLGREFISVSVFVNLAHYLSKHDVLALARDTSLFGKAKKLFTDEELPSSWSDCLREWSKTSPELGLQFYCEIRGLQANPRKRGTDTPVPETKRQCVILPEAHDASQNHLPSAETDRTKEPLVANESMPNITGTISTNTTTPPRTPELGTQQTPDTRPVDNTAPEDSSRPRPTNTRDPGDLNKHPTQIPETHKKIMAMTLSRCRVAVYPVQVFPDLIQPMRQDIQFRRQEPGGLTYRSDLIRSGAGQFHIVVSQGILDKLGQRCDDQDDIVVPSSLAAALFIVGDCHLATSIFWPTRGSVTHIRKGCDVLWESVSDWAPFLNHLWTKRSHVPELCSLQTMLLSFPASEGRPDVRHAAPSVASFF